MTQFSCLLLYNITVVVGLNDYSLSEHMHILCIDWVFGLIELNIAHIIHFRPIHNPNTDFHYKIFSATRSTINEKEHQFDLGSMTLMLIMYDAHQGDARLVFKRSTSC